MGVPQLRILESRPNEVCRIISEFALEYRTTRERVHQQMEKKANHRERNKTRGKMIIDVAKFRTQEDRADCELRLVAPKMFFIKKINFLILIPNSDNFLVPQLLRALKTLKVLTFSHRYDGIDPAIFDRRYYGILMKILPMAMTISSNRL